MASSPRPGLATSPRAEALQEFGVTSDTRGIMRANQADDEGFELPKKSKGRKQSRSANTNLADAKATDNALELLTSSTSPTRMSPSMAHSTRPAASESAPSLRNLANDNQSAAQRDLSKLSRKGLLLLAEQNNIDVSFVSHDIDEMRRLIQNDYAGESESKDSRTASMPSLEGDSEDEKKRESSFEQLPVADPTVDAAKSKRLTSHTMNMKGHEDDSLVAVEGALGSDGVGSFKADSEMAIGVESVSTTSSGAIVIDESQFGRQQEIALSPLISSASSSSSKKKKKNKSSPPQTTTVATSLVQPRMASPPTTTVSVVQSPMASPTLPVAEKAVTATKATDSKTELPDRAVILDSPDATRAAKSQQSPSKASQSPSPSRPSATSGKPLIDGKPLPEGEVSNSNHRSELSTARSEKDRLAKEWEFKHSLPQDLTRLTLSIGDFRTFGASPGNPLATDGHVRFRIVRQLDEDVSLSPQFVFRRFRDFQALYLRLAHLFPLEVIPALPAPSLPSIFKSDEFLHTRARRLEAFMYCLLRTKSKALLASDDLSAFLLKESEEFDELAVKYLGNQGKDASVPPLAVSEKLTSGFSMLMSKFASSASGSDDQKSSNPSSASASAMSGGADDVRGEISTSYEALQITIDHHGQPQERAQIWEALVDALEQLGSVTVSRAGLMSRLGDLVAEVASPTMIMVDNEGANAKLLGKAIDPVNEVGFVRALGGANKAVYERNQQGCLKVAHQAASLLGGARTMHARVMATPSEIPEALLRESARDVMKKFDRVKRETSGFAVDLVQEFGRISLESAHNERERLEALKASILDM